MTHELPAAVARHIDAVNAFDLDAIAETFAPDAYVNDNRREIRGAAAIRQWLAKEIVGDRVTLDVRDIVEHYGDVIVRAAYAGDFDKSNLPPGELVLSNYFSIRDGRIVSLTILFNRPSPYSG
jgi:hypothetical protein